MAQQKIFHYPHPILRRAADSVPDATAGVVQKLITDLCQTMVKNNGIGLAAQQIGVSLSVVVIQAADGIIGLINPKIVAYSRRFESNEEGCLSVPGVYGLVPRSKRVRVHARLPNGQEKTFTAVGLFARVLQHEVDHCHGVLFLDRVKKITSGADRLRELWREGSASKQPARRL